MKNDLLLQVLERYSSCQSYTDEGVQHHSLRQSAKFASYFVRPDRFRFEWRGKAPFRFTLCIVGDEARLSMGDISLDNRLPDDAINRSMGLSMSQVPFIVSLLVPGKYDLVYNLLDYGPFEESECKGGDDGNKWFTTLEQIGVPQEKLLLDPNAKAIIERTVKVRSTEHEAKLSASRYFEESDPVFSNLLAKEGEAVKNAGVEYKSVFNEVCFDQMSDALIREKFSF